LIIIGRNGNTKIVLPKISSSGQHAKIAFIMKEFIYGRNPVYETLRAKRRNFFRLLIAQNVKEKGRLIEVLDLVEKNKIPIEHVPRTQLDKVSENHQGVAIEASAYPYVGLEDILENALTLKEDLFILILDMVQNPQNLGTLIRTAEAVGVHGVIMPTHRTASITPAVVSASAGACEHMMVVQTNLAQAILQLKKANVWVIGLDQHPESVTPSDIHFDRALAIVVGNEGEGIRPLVRNSCDFLLRFPMQGRIESLNAAVAGSIGLYIAYMERYKT
jgi:23S rRNA (guanosine2251-2'-O)-methyltransferase